MPNTPPPPGRDHWIPHCLRGLARRAAALPQNLPAIVCRRRRAALHPSALPDPLRLSDLFACVAVIHPYPIWVVALLTVIHIYLCKIFTVENTYLYAHLFLQARLAKNGFFFGQHLSRDY